MRAAASWKDRINSGDRYRTVLRFARFFVVAIVVLFVQTAIAATISPRPLTTTHKKNVKENARARRHMRHLARSRSARPRRTVARRHRYSERFLASSYANDITDGDVTTGEDPVVRQAAIDALGNMNGTVLAIQPTSGRILA